MALKTVVEALKWKYPESECQADDGKIIYWNCPGVPQPTKQQCRDIIAEYEVYLDEQAKIAAQKKVELPTKKADLLAKLNLTNDDFKLLKRLILKGDE